MVGVSPYLPGAHYLGGPAKMWTARITKTSNNVGAVDKDEVSTKDLSELLEMLSNYYEGENVIEIHIFPKVEK